MLQKISRLASCLIVMSLCQHLLFAADWSQGSCTVQELVMSLCHHSLFAAEPADADHSHDYPRPQWIRGPLGGSEPADPKLDEVTDAISKARSDDLCWLILSCGQPHSHVRFSLDKIADWVDPPRIYPLVGAAQLHHIHYKCSVSYQEPILVLWPFPHFALVEMKDSLYMDHNHLHFVTDKNGARTLIGDRSVRRRLPASIASKPTLPRP